MCEPPSTSKVLARAIPCLDHILIDGYSGVDIRDHYLVTGFDVAQMRNEVHPRVVAFKRRLGAWVAGVRNPMCCEPGQSLMHKRERQRGGNAHVDEMAKNPAPTWHAVLIGVRVNLVSSGLCLAGAMIDGFPRVEYKSRGVAGRRGAKSGVHT